MLTPERMAECLLCPACDGAVECELASFGVFNCRCRFCTVIFAVIVGARIEPPPAVPFECTIPQGVH